MRPAALLFILLVFGLNAFPQTITLPGGWKQVTPEVLFGRKNFSAYPYECRRRILTQVDPRFAALAQGKQLDLLWDIEKELAQKEKRPPVNFVIWDQADPKCCESVFQNGEQILIIYHGPLTLGTTVYVEGDLTVAWVYAALANDSKFRVDIIPENFSYAPIAPKVALHAPRDSARIGASGVRRARIWAGVIAGLAGSARSTTSTYESGTVSGTYNSGGRQGTFDGTYSGTSTTTQPDYETREQAQRTAGKMIGRAQDRAAQLSNTALRATTVMPGEKISGLVYFPRDKSTRAAVLRIRVGRVDFEFPISWK